MAEVAKEQTATCMVCQTIAPVSTMQFVIGDEGTCSPDYARRCFTAYMQLDGGRDPTEDELDAADALMQSLFGPDGMAAETRGNL